MKTAEEAWDEVCLDVARIAGKPDLTEEEARILEAGFKGGFNRALTLVMEGLLRADMLISGSDKVPVTERLYPDVPVSVPAAQPMYASPVRTEWPWETRRRLSRQQAP